MTKISCELLIGDFHPPFPSDHLSNEKRAPGCLGYTGDEILPSYVGILKSHYKYYKDPGSPLDNQYNGKYEVFLWLK